MPMPALDPLRYVPVVPADPSHRVPMALPGRFFSQDPANPDLADTFDPYVAQLLAGGSLRRACTVATAAAQAAAAAGEKAAAASAPTSPVTPAPTPAPEPAPPAPAKPAA